MASGDSLLQWDALGGRPPAANYATLDFRNAIPVLDFDADTIEATVFQGVLPRHYAGGGITTQLTWMASSATSGNVRWRVEIERGNTDMDADSFATGNEATGAANATNGIQTTTSIAHTSGAQMDSLVAGEPFRVRVSRVANDGTNDTMLGDAELVTVEIRET